MKIAVIENEYGAVSIDTALVEENVREVSSTVILIVVVQLVYQEARRCNVAKRRHHIGWR